MIARLLRTLSQRFVEADPLKQQFSCPTPFLHLTLWVQPVRPSGHMRHLAEIWLLVAVDAKPGSLSELEVAASCSLIWPSRLTACLPGWLTDWI